MLHSLSFFPLFCRISAQFRWKLTGCSQKLTEKAAICWDLHRICKSLQKFKFRNAKLSEIAAGCRDLMRICRILQNVAEFCRTSNSGNNSRNRWNYSVHHFNLMLTEGGSRLLGRRLLLPGAASCTRCTRVSPQAPPSSLQRALFSRGHTREPRLQNTPKSHLTQSYIGCSSNYYYLTFT